MPQLNLRIVTTALPPRVTHRLYPLNLNHANARQVLISIHISSPLDLICETEKEDMKHDFSDVKAPEIEFKDHIHGHRYSEIFLVQIRGIICVMKVVSASSEDLNLNSQ